MKTVLFVCYGSGHVRMVLPVARALAAQGIAKPLVLGLTTAAPLVLEAGLPLLQFKHFVTPDDAAAMAHGRELLGQLPGTVADPDESAAYLGLSYADLVASHGADEAARRYAERGRHAFLPLGSLRRILLKIKPDLLVVTNSPRAERAAVLAAGELGIPAVCIVDLFAIDEVQWIGERHYAQRVCVLNEAVKDFVVKAGRAPEQIVVTGNPAFDALFDPEVARQGKALRAAHGWQGKKVILWPSQTEPAVHPFDRRPGDPTLPGRLLQRLLDWLQWHDDVVLCVRPRTGEAPLSLPHHPRVQTTGQDWPLPALLYATDLVVTLSSTVGLEGHLTGARVLQVLGSVFDHAMPMQACGISDEAVLLDAPAQALEAALAHCLALSRRPVDHHVLATDRVLQVLRTVLH